jgi:hypothetical protein
LKELLLILAVTFCLTVISGNLFAQNIQPKPAKKIVQVSGLVVSGESSFGVPGVYFLIPNAGRGTVTNEVGYFSIPTLAGDSALIRGVGFKPQTYLVPNDGRDGVSVIIYLQADTTLLPMVEVEPFPTEQEFKQAILKLKLPDGDFDKLRRNLDENTLARMRFEMPMTAKMNFNQAMNANIGALQNRNMPPPLQLMNPFAWGRFIESVKRGDLKKKKWQDD